MGQTANVRALRAYENEHVTPELINEHLAQIHNTLTLIDRAVNQTPYQPGDAWVKVLPLDAIKAAQTAEAIARNPSAEVKPTLLKVYTSHVNDVLDRVARLAGPTLAPTVAAAASAVIPSAPPGLDELDAGVPLPALPPVPVPVVDPRFPSILAGLSQVDPGLSNLRAALDEQKQLAMRLSKAEADLDDAKAHAVPQAQLAQSSADVASIRSALAQQKAALQQQLDQKLIKDPRSKQIIEDAMSVTSVALRLALEAASMTTMVLLEASSLSHQSASEWVRNAPSTIQFVQDTPGKIKEIGRELEADATGLKQLVAALAKLNAIDPSDVPGFQYRDGLVDEIVGFGWDSVHLEAEAGGEAYFYNSLASKETSTSSGDTYDYTGRTYKLVYHVDPIVLASANLSAKFDFAKLPDAMGLKFGYATNRVYKSGGDLENSGFASQLGVTGRWSDALDAALFIAGVRTKVRIARFTSGTVDLVQVADGTRIATSPFSFSEKEIDVDYDFVPRDTPLLKSATLGLGYFDYTLPRILYELDNVTPELDNASYVYARETPPQAVRTRLAVLGVTARVEQPATPTLNVFFSFNGSLGVGPLSYYFLKDTTLPDEESNRDHTSHLTIGAGLNGRLGFRWRFVGADARFNAHIEAAYQAQFLDSQINSSTKKDKTINSGSTDLFHGPAAALGGSF